MEYDITKLRGELLKLDCLSDENLYELLIPEEERHSPYANLDRAKDIFKQCLYRVKDSLKDVYTNHKHMTNLGIDFAVYLIPLLSVNPTIPSNLILVLAILIMRHGIEFISEQ